MELQHPRIQQASRPASYRSVDAESWPQRSCELYEGGIEISKSHVRSFVIRIFGWMMVLTWSTKDDPGRRSYLQVPDMNPRGASIGWTASDCKVVLYRELRTCFFVLVWVLDGWKKIVADKNSGNMRRTPLYIIICLQLNLRLGFATIHKGSQLSDTARIVQM